jgi:transcription antitermination protein NusB
MGSRSTGRKLAMQSLYQVDIRKVDAELVIENYILDNDLPEDTKNWSIYLVKGVSENLEEIDSQLTAFSIGWDIQRFNLVDKNILRVAFYELLFTETPHTIVIDEAIELSKKFSTEDSPKFINGILGAYIKKKA